MKRSSLYKNSTTADSKRSCGKVRWDSKAKADQALIEIQKRGSKRKQKPIRSYECDMCKGWHLTSRRDNKQTDKLTNHARHAAKFKHKGKKTLKADDAFELLKNMRQRTIDELNRPQ